MTGPLRISSVTLRVREISRSADFYVGRLGFRVLARQDGQVHLGVPEHEIPLLTLIAGARRTAPRESAGLFHAALLLPSRAALATWLSHAAGRDVDFEGFSDHGVSEAIYLSDPDDNGLEFYADRPPNEWPRQDGELAMTTRPLAIPALLALADRAQAPLAGARWGHLHLRVTQLDRSETFYRETLGLAVTQRSYPGARFLAADGYHHHLGLNTWGTPRQAVDPEAAGLADVVFERDDGGLQRLADPDGLAFHVRRPAQLRQDTLASAVNAP